MSLAAGARLGPYEILTPLGEGGMGQVYRARDTRLDRDVAIKILPSLFSSDADRLARFEREAKALASLNHPNIAHVYGVEPHEGGRALVMELVEGDDLSVRIARGAMPITEALPIARQIAEALEAAHERGVIHRDLKPANIKVREDGTVKVLDFGLAKAMDPAGTSGVSAMNSPTFTSPATQLGMIIGTAAYMAPEQAKGKAVDRRADVWAFGVVLHEMLTGRRLFEGEDVTEVLASVLKDSPSHDALPVETPHAVRRLLRRCLEKDRTRRLDSMAAARLEIDDALGARDERPEAIAPVAARPRGRVAAAMLGTAVAAGLLGAGVVWGVRQPAAAPPVRLSFTPLPGQAIRLETNHHDLAIARDGSRIVYWGHDARGMNKLFVRSMAAFDTQVIDAGREARGMFFSHDGGWIAFQSGGLTGSDALLMKVPVGGGNPARIAAIDGNLRGASWGPDQTIVFATHRQGTGLFRVPASGGTADMLTKPDAAAGELDHVWPSLLPGGTHALFAIRRVGTSDIGVVDLRSRAWRVVIKDGTMPAYAPTGHVIHATGGMLLAAPFDLERMETRGQPIRVVEGVVTKESGAADYALADSGTLVYVPGSAASPRQSLAWIDREGRREPVAVEPRPYRSISVSPDGAKAAVSIEEEISTGLWVVDLVRFTLTRLTPPGMSVGMAAWSPDSRWIAFGGGPATGPGGGIHRVAATGTAPPELLVPNSGVFRRNVTDWTREGGILFVDVIDGSPALMRVAVETREVTTVLNDLGGETGGRLSPNGRWLAYVSSETARPEVYIRPYPNVSDDRIAVTSGGMRAAVWRADGRELTVRDLSGGVLRIAVTYAGEKIQLGTPERIIAITDLPRSSALAPSPDGSRFLTPVRAEADTSVDEYRVVLNWFEELKSKFK